MCRDGPGDGVRLIHCGRRPLGSQIGPVQDAKLLNSK
jgi:hypothetical protein